MASNPLNEPMTDLDEDLVDLNKLLRQMKNPNLFQDRCEHQWRRGWDKRSQLRVIYCKTCGKVRMEATNGLPQ